LLEVGVGGELAAVVSARCCGCSPRAIRTARSARRCTWPKGL
jgi:hypothetical protein